MDKIEKAMENKYKELKKTVDNNINTVNRGLTARIAKLEADAETWIKEKTAMQTEVDTLKIKNESMQEEINILNAKVASLEDREEGEITASGKEALKEELTKALTDTMEDKIEAKRDGWVEVVKKNMKKEVKEEVKEETKVERELEGTLLVNATIEEEKMRQARKLNVRVTGLEETTADKDGEELCKKLGYEEDTRPFARAWWVGRDPSKRALMLQFTQLEERASFLKKRVILKTLPGDPIYLDDDLTVLQVQHRKTCMPRIRELRKEGKKAFYRDGRIFVDGKPIP